jgi:uncharacterized OB-fold protein
MIDLLVAGLRAEAHERPFWDALREHRLVLQRCTGCGHFQHYPRSLCKSCLSDALEFVASPGHGTVGSFTVIHRAPLAELRPLTPYMLALIDLDEGVRMMSNVVAEPRDVYIGCPVAVDFVDLASEVTLPVFRPVVSTPTREP